MKKSILFAALLTFAFGATAMAAPKAAPAKDQKVTTSVCKDAKAGCKTGCKDCKASKTASASCDQHCQDKKAAHEGCKDKVAPAAHKTGHENCKHAH